MLSTYLFHISQATNSIQAMLGTSQGKTQLQSTFKLCGPMLSENDIELFMQWLMGNWMGTVQYNDEQGNPININYLCNIMLNHSSNPLQAYAAISNLFLLLQNMPCLDVSYSDTILQMQNLTQGDSGVGIRQWTYQTCAEFGYFQTTDSPSTVQPFGNMVPLNLSTQMCSDTFGIDFNTAELVNETNAYYGGKNLMDGPTNILFVNGNIDPWHSLSIIDPLPPGINAILINGTAHCADDFPPTPSDPPGLAEAQNATSKAIGVMLSEYYGYLNGRN